MRKSLTFLMLVPQLVSNGYLQSPYALFSPQYIINTFIVFFLLTSRLYNFALFVQYTYQTSSLPKKVGAINSHFLQTQFRNILNWVLT
uniref:Uncharacterized protein n=1 Tax=Panstrongylus lignarius TaxID=156445 RepID=A0A224XRZ9_9HEMI